MALPVVRGSSAPVGSRGISSSSLVWRWLPATVWMALIFRGSGDGLSAAHTSRWLEPLLRWLLGGGVSVDGIEWAHFLMRKAGHVSEYAVLAVLLWRALLPTPPSSPTAKRTFRPGRAGWLAVGLATAFAASDEFHQAFVPSRGASVADVCLDAAGATLGVLSLAAWRWGRARRRRARVRA